MENDYQYQVTNTLWASLYSVLIILQLQYKLSGIILMMKMMMMMMMMMFHLFVLLPLFVHMVG